jgi:hypothetical protein
VKAFKLIFVGRKIMHLLICGSLKSAKSNWVRKSQIRKSQKTHRPQIANPQIATFAEGSQT